MRIYLYLFFSLLFVSCQIDPDDENTRIEKIPALEIQIPPEMTAGLEDTISFKYPLPNGCYSFYSVDVVDVSDANHPDKNIREVTVFAEIANETFCTEEYIEESYYLAFRPMESKDYLFRFWTGQNEHGIDEFEEFELVVE